MFPVPLIMAVGGVVFAAGYFTDRVGDATVKIGATIAGAGLLYYYAKKGK